MIDSLCRVGGVFASAVLAAGWLLGGCYTQPYDGQVTNGQPFVVNGYTDIPSAAVAIEMYDYPGVWLQVGSAVSSSTASHPAGAISQNSPALYYFTTTVNPTTEWYDGRVGYLRVRNVTSNTAVYGGGYSSLTCFMNRISRTADFYGIAWECGFNLSQVTLYNGAI
jgi:hypothetical protein